MGHGASSAGRLGIAHDLVSFASPGHPEWPAWIRVAVHRSRDGRAAGNRKDSKPGPVSPLNRMSNIPFPCHFLPS